MTTNNDAIAALPTNGNADKALLRGFLTKRVAYCLDTTEVVTNFVAVDPDTGSIPLYLIQSNILFKYDSTDSTTVNDGVTCLVTSDGKRYKAATITAPYSVLTAATVAQPASSSVGDRYLVPTAATGAQWSGKDGQVAIYTAAGWAFAIIPVGRALYIQDIDARYYRNASGVWTAGVGSVSFASASVPLSAIIGLAASFTLRVENQTTNTPPVSPTVGVSYIIGSIPTGAWAGNVGKVARCEATGVFTIYAPAAGDTVFDKSLSNSVQWNGTAWVSASGAIIGHTEVFSVAGTTTIGGVAGYGYLPSTAPTTANRNTRDNACALTYTARKTGALLEFDYRAYSATIGVVTALGLFIDSNTTAAAWVGLTPFDSGNPFAISETIQINAPDAAAHTYYFAIMVNGADPAAPTRRLARLKEYA